MPYSLARLRQTTRARERPTRPVSSCRKFSGGAKLEVDAIHCKRKTAAAMITPARMAGLAGVKGKNHLVLVVSYETNLRWRAFTFPLDVEGDVLPSQQLAFLASVRLRQLGTLAAEPALPDAGGDADGEGGDDEAGGGAELVGDELAVMYVLHSKSVSQTVLDQIWVQLRNDVVGEVLGTIVR